jgi:hypothetical protein
LKRKSNALLRSIIGLLIVMLMAQPLLPVHAQTATPPATPETRKGKIVADTGFRPGKDGFSFQNYTNRTNPQNLTPQDMFTIFGEPVCAQLKDGVCKLTPVAAQQMEKVNALMNGGHCDGMAALALLIYQNAVAAAQFGANSANGIPFNGNDAVQREIARWFMKQTVDPVYGEKLRFINEKITPATVLDTLIKTMNDRSELFVLQVFRLTGRNWDGHAVTPYAVEDMGGGKFHILVYDNNHPNVERFVEVDKNANTWKFFADLNPEKAGGLFTGDATTGTLMLLPLSQRKKQAVCNFCDKPAATNGSAVTPTAAPNAAPTYNMVIMSTDSVNDTLSILIKDEQGRRLGFDGDRFYNDIPNAFFVPVANRALRQGEGEGGDGDGDGDGGGEGGDQGGDPDPVATEDPAADPDSAATPDADPDNDGDLDPDAPIDEDGDGDTDGTLTEEDEEDIEDAGFDEVDELWEDSVEPLYYLPTGRAFTVVIDGRELHPSDEQIASVAVFGPTYGTVIDEITMIKGVVDEIRFDADGRTFAYKSNTGESPEIFFGSSEPDADYGFGIQGVDLTANGELTVKFDPVNRTLQIGTRNITESASLAIGIERVDETTEAEFYAEDVELQPGWIIAADWGKWDGKTGLDILTDTNGDATFEKTDRRQSQPRPGGAAYLQAASGGTFAHVQDDQYTLTLAQPAATTSYIDSKPPYASAPLDTAKVAAQWSTGNAQAVTNAVLEIDRASIALELSAPRFDPTARTLTYAVRVLSITPVGGTRTSKVPPGAFGASNLIIAENAALRDALTTGGKKISDLIAGGINPPDLNAGGINPPDLNAGGINPPDLNAGTTAGEFALGYYQTARSGSLAKNGDTFALTLNSAYPLVQVVAQAPNLGTAWISSDSLHKVWNTYASTTATAMLTANGKRILLRLSRPVSDPAKGTIIYQAQVIGGEPLASFENPDLLIASDSAFSAALTLSLNTLRNKLNAGGINPPDLNAGAGNLPDLNAGGINPPDLNAGGINPPDLNAGGINLIFGAEKPVTPETAKACQDALTGIVTILKPLDGKLPDAAATVKLTEFETQAIAACPLSAQVFTPEARRQGNGITSIALPPTR